MKKIFVCSLAFLLGSSGAMAQSVSDRVELNEKESVGMTLSRFSPVKPKSEDANALLRYPMLRLVRQDEPTKPSIPYAERTFTERKAQHAAPNQVGDIMRAAAGRELWGNVTYSNAWESYDYRGFYTFDTSVNPLQMQMLGTNGSFYMEGNGGAVFQDGTLYVVRYATYGSYFFIYINTYDPETFVQMGSTSTEDVTFVALETATNPATGKTYGVFYNSDATGFVLGTVDYTTMTRKDFGALEHPYVALGVTKDDVIYGVATDGNLYRIDQSTCEETLIGSTGVELLLSDGGHYGQSGEIDTKTGIFYWACKDAQKNAALYTVDLQTGAATKLADFPGQETVYGLYVPPAPAEDGAPAAVENLNASFTDNSLVGKVAFTAPTATYAGGTLSGQLSYYVMVGNDTLATGKTYPGAFVRETVTVPEGVTTFRVTTANEIGSSPENKVKVYVGNDEPTQVKDVNLAIDPETGVAKLTWSPVTTGINGGYIGNITYNVVRYPDSTTVATGLAATEFTETFSAEEPLQTYSYGVAAVNDTQTGVAGISNKSVFGAAIVPPYSEPLDNEGALELYTIIDNNEDGSTWEFNEKEGAASYKYSRVNDGDDWLITPAIQLKGGKLYSVSFETCGYGYTYHERIEVKYGNQPTVAGMTHQLLDSTDIMSPNYTKFTREIAADTDQKVYVGFHAISPADEFRLYLKNVQVYEGLSLTLADSVQQLSLVPAEKGELRVDGSFKTPSLTLGGDTLGNSLTKVEVLRNGKLLQTYEAPDTASVLTFTDDQPVNGFNNYVVKVYTAEGEGRPAHAQIYVGVDTPKYPKRPKLTDQSNSIHMAWKAVGNTGANGGYVDTDKVWYRIYDVDQSNNDMVAELRDSVQGTSYDIDYDTNAGEQKAIQFGLSASNSAGNSLIVGSDPLIVGQAYTLPFRESLAQCAVSNFWWGDRTGNSAFTLSNENASDGDGGCFALNTAAPQETAWINSGKIALGGVANPKLYFSHYADTRSDMKLTVEVQKPDGTVDSLYTFDYKTLTQDDDNEWRRESVSLKEYASLPYVIVRFRGEIGVKAYSLYLDDIVVENIFVNDLKAEIITPGQLRKNKTSKVSIKVTNKGDKPANRYTAALYANGEEVDAETVEDVLNPLQSRTFTFDYTPSLFDEGETVELKAVAEFDDDDYTDDNEVSAVVKVLTPDQAKPENVSAEAVGAGTGQVNVAWAQPNDESASVTDDMESYTSWSVDDFGFWNSVYGEPKGGAGQIYSSVPYPHQGEKFGFMVFDPRDWSWELTDKNPSLKPHSGKKYLASFYNYTEEAGSVEFYDSNDWLVSPTLSGEAQTISFWVNNVKAGDSDNVEKFELLYSVAGNDTTEFVKLGDTYTVSGGEWQQITASLPAGATHFAIRHCTDSKHSFVFMVDDVCYVGGSGVLKGYNVYRDQTLVATLEPTQTTFTDSKVPDGTHTYAVTALYAEGESAPAFSQRVTTAISALAVEDGKPFDAYTVDGKLVGRNLTSLKQLKKGTYVINDKTVVVK